MQSIASDGFPFDGTDSNDSGFVSFTPAQPFTFADVTSLVADYKFTDGDCAGGALRWSLSIDANGDNVRDGSAWVYYGNTASGWNTCTGAFDQSGVNMMTLADGRWDNGQLSAFGGTYGQTLAQTRNLFDTATVLRISLALDGGWGANGDQVVRLGGAAVNDNALPLLAPVASPTCDLPQAKIEIVKNDPNPDGAVNETPDSVQNADAGQYFRNVDCKYIYNLDVSTLGPLASRAGTFRVYANIGGTRVTTSPAKFDLR
jgi:hypothetical protein